MAGAARARGETGASLVEFALVLPLFFMLLLGMFTGGLAYSRRFSVADATREAVRFGATLPLTAEANLDSWLRRVGDVAVSTSDGELHATESGASICVSFVPGTGTGRRMQKVGIASPVFTNGTCFDDGRGNEPRVQVTAQRTSRLETLVWSRDLVIESRSVSRFEAG